MKQLLLLLIIFCLPLLGKAQSVEGIIKEKNTGKAIDGALVVVLGSKGNTVAYKMTDEKGFYQITFKQPSDSLRLQVSLLGYETRIVPLEKGTQKLNLSLHTQDFQLKEVSVRPNYVRLKEDTIAYNVAGLQVQSDRSIGDVLKRIPGIEVSKSGGITYQGESINKFYIEGMDLLEQKYGIATNNVPVDAISTVEVIENHQPINMLKNRILSSKAAINLKLKKDKKIRPVGTADAGLGYDSDDLLWSLQAFGLQVAPKRQTIVMYKTNNKGDDVTLEFTDQSTAMTTGNIQSFQSLPQGMFPRVGMRNPPLEEKRYLFNNSHVLTLNNLWKTKENGQLRVNVNYINDRRNEIVQERSSYYIREDSMLLIDEFNSSKIKNNMLEGILNYTENEKGHYFHNTLKGIGRWSDLQSEITTRSKVSQYYDLPDYHIRNDLTYIKKAGNRFWNINSQVSYSSLPQALSVEIDTMEIETSQKIYKSGFYTNTRSSFSYKKGLSTFNANLSLDASFDDLNTNLSHYLVPDSFRNDLCSDYIKTIFSPEYTLGNNVFSLGAGADLVYHWLDIDDKMYDETNSYSYFYADPSLRLNYSPNSRWRFSSAYRYNHSIGDIQDFTTGYIMMDYRSLQTKSGQLSKNESQNIHLRIDYKDPLNGFYFNASGMYSARTRNLISQTRFIDKLNISGNMLQDNNSSMWTGNGYISKNFYKIATNISLSVGYNFMSSEKWQQGVFYPFNSSTLAFNPAANVRVNKYFYVSYSGQFIHNMQEITNSFAGKTESSFDQIIQNFKTYYFVNKNLQLKLQAEYLNNEISPTVNSELFFLDLGISYSYKQLEFTFDWNNILNEKSYSYVIYNGLDSYGYNYKLRPESLFAAIKFKF